MIKAIIFDCFGVLTVDSWHAFLDSLPPGADIQRARDLNRAFDSGFISHDEFFDGVQQLTGHRPPDVESISADSIVKNHALIEHIKQLKPNYKIGILSNISSDWITRELLDAQEQELFDDMMFSYQVGMAKPDLQIFHLACERLGVDPTDAVMIDDVERNITAARDIGMQGVVYKNFADYEVELNSLLNPNN